jgi:hypothetical protein
MKKYLLLILFVGTMIMIVVMAKTGAPLKTPTTPLGILDLEFAYNNTKVNTVLGAWKPTLQDDKIEAAKINTYYDFVFLSFYSLFLFFSCRQIAQSNNSKIGDAIAKGALLTGVLDIIENIGMLVSLSNHSSNMITMGTTIISIIKWGLAIAAVLYVLWGIVSTIITKKGN